MVYTTIGRKSSLPRLVTFTVLAVPLLTAIILTALPAESALQSASSNEKISLPDAARHLGLSLSWRPAEGKLILTAENHSATILIGSERLMIDNRLMLLSDPVEASNGTVTILLKDSIELFSRLLDRQVSEEEIASRGVLSGQHAGGEATLVVRNVRYISYPEFTRVIINVSGHLDAEKVRITALEEARTLTIQIPDGRYVEPLESVPVADRFVETIEPYQTRSDVKIVVRTIVGNINYEMQQYLDPPRIVVDIQPNDPPIVTDFLSDRLPDSELDEPSEPLSQAPYGDFQFTTVVIDPGHGGKDQGARGHGGLLEKEVSLAIALKLKVLIEERPGMKAVLTRTGDYFVSLKERAAIANHAKEGIPADLFISIHTNAHVSQKVSGFEAYYISDAIDPDAKATAALENAVVEFERDFNKNEEDSALAPILWDLQFTEFVSESSDFAFIAQRELGKRLTTRNRGVRQAPFIVLAGVSMPSILIEVGFISNRIEETKMRTTEFRNNCAEGLAAAVAAIKERHDLRLGLLDRKDSNL